MEDYIFLTVGRIGSTNDIITQKLNYIRRNDKIPELLRVLTEGKDRYFKLAILLAPKISKDCVITRYLKRYRQIW